MKTFSKPLSASEEAHYLQLLKEGDGDEAEKAREILIERNLRLVAHIAKKYQNTDEDMEDLISIGTIGLIKAVSSFDAGKGKLSTYASRCIDNELLMLFRSKKKSAREISIYEPIGTDKEGNEINFLDIYVQEQPDVIEQMELSQNAERLKRFLSKVLTGREREIIFLRYGLVTGREVTQREIGEKLNISRSYVSRIEKRALAKLKKSFEEDDIRDKDKRRDCHANNRRNAENSQRSRSI